MNMRRIFVFVVLMLLSMPVIEQLNTNTVTVSFVGCAGTNETLENINDTLARLNDTLYNLNNAMLKIVETENQTITLLNNLYTSILGNETNVTSILQILVQLYTMQESIKDAIGQPTNAEGQPINATVFSALSSLAVELYTHREALHTLGENQKNLSKFDQSIINRMDDRTQMVLGKIENESANTIGSVNNNIKALAGSNSLTVAASVFTAIIVIFFILIWEILGLKNRFERKKEMYEEREYAPGLAYKKLRKPECFGDPNVFDANSPECQQCMFFDECERQALSEQAIRDLRQTREEKKPSENVGSSYFDKLGLTG